MTYRAAAYLDEDLTLLPKDRVLDAYTVGTALELRNNAALTVPQLSPVAAGFGAGVGGMLLARADSLFTMPVVGFTVADCLPMASVMVQASGVLIGTTAHWSSIANSLNGLTPGDMYYLSPAIAGRITNQPPTSVGDYLLQVGRALSNTELLLQIESPIGL